MTDKTLIGRKEIAGLPDLSINNIMAKIDTGAYTSSIHCHKAYEKDNQLFCYFLDPSFPEYNQEPIIFNTYHKKNVKSSNGITENRFKIISRIFILGKIYTIDLTITDRKEMKYPLLIGRKFLHKKFIVDVSKKFNHI